MASLYWSECDNKKIYRLCGGVIKEIMQPDCVENPKFKPWRLDKDLEGWRKARDLYCSKNMKVLVPVVQQIISNIDPKDLPKEVVINVPYSGACDISEDLGKTDDYQPVRFDKVGTQLIIGFRAHKYIVRKFRTAVCNLKLPSWANSLAVHQDWN